MQMPKEMPMFPIGFGAFLVWVSGYGRTEPMSGWGSVLVLLTVVLYMVPGAGLEPARPQWPGDFKSPVSTNFTTRAKSGVQRARRIPRETAIQSPEPHSPQLDFHHPRQILFL